MSEQIIGKNPPITDEIIEAINNNQLAIIFGSGTSRIIGCGSWKNLADSLVETCFSKHKMDNASVTCINYKQRDALLNMQDSKKNHYNFSKNIG